MTGAVTALWRRGRPTRSVTNGAVIAGTVLVAAILTRAVTASAEMPVPAAMRDAATLAISVFVESIPFVILGILLSVVVQFWVPPLLLERALPRRPAARRAALSLFGVVLPVCECGNVPLARGLMQRGFTPAESLTFLLAAPILNPVTILTTYHAFGWDSGILVARVIGGFAISNLIGWWLSGHPRPQDLLTPGFQASCAHDHDGGAGASRWQRSAAAIRAEFATLMPALVIGSAIAGAIQVGAFRGALVALGSHPLWSVLALLALAFVVSICSNVDAFFVLSLSGSFLPGSVVAFLLLGAMLDLKMVALLRTTFRMRVIASLVVVIAGCSAAIGWGMNLVG